MRYYGLIVRLLFVASLVLFFIPAHFSQQLPDTGVSAVSVAQAQDADDPFGLNTAVRNTGIPVGEGGDDPIGVVIGRIIERILEVVGILFLFLIIWGGITWMTAGGNEERIAKAKKTLTAATIGLIIIMLGYAITYFIVEGLYTATSNLDSGVDTEGT